MNETIEFIPNTESLRQKEDILKKGYTHVCLQCRSVYKAIPTRFYEEISCEGAFIPECPACGCDLFCPIEDIRCIDIMVKPVDGKIILKQHNFKYCKCDKGKIWTGDAGTECWASFKLLGKLEGGIEVYECSVSGLTCIVLPSTQDELDNAGFLRYP